MIDSSIDYDDPWLMMLDPYNWLVDPHNWLQLGIHHDIDTDLMNCRDQTN